MTYFYAAASGSDLRWRCGQLQQQCGLAPFRFSDDPGGSLSYEWGTHWESAWSISPERRVFVTRGKGRKKRSIAWAIPDFPEWANFQLAYQADEPSAQFEAVLDELFKGNCEKYTEVDSIWTISQELDVPARFVTLEVFAAFTLKMCPNLDQPGITFESQVQFEGVKYWASCVESGLTVCALNWLREGKPISGLRINLTAMEYHEVDMRASAIQREARKALELVMEKHGVKL